MIPIALQLYTLREDMEKDFIESLKKVADIGYEGVELSGFGGFGALELKGYLDSFGLKPVGAHVSFDLLKNNLEDVIEYNLYLGNKYVVLPWAAYNGKEDFLRMAENLNKIGEKLKKEGLMLCYHNHHHEFKQFDGEYGLDIIYNNVPSDVLMAEVDAYWTAFAGVDPISYIKKYSGRTPLIHIKDVVADDSRDFTEIGTGIFDISSFIRQAEENGAEWLIVEQDACKMETFESIMISLRNLKKINLV